MREVTSQPRALQCAAFLPACALGREARAPTYRERQLPLSAVDADWRAMTPEQRQDHPTILVGGDQSLMQRLTLRAAALHYAARGGSVSPKNPLNFHHPGFPVSNRSLAPHIDVRRDIGYDVPLPPLILPGRVRCPCGPSRELAALPPMVAQLPSGELARLTVGAS